MDVVGYRGLRVGAFAVLDTFLSPSFVFVGDAADDDDDRISACWRGDCCCRMTSGDGAVTLSSKMKSANAPMVARAFFRGVSRTSLLADGRDFESRFRSRLGLPWASPAC